MDTTKLQAEIQGVTRPNGRRYFSEELRAKVKAAVFALRKTGISHEKIADALSVSQATVGRYLRADAPKSSPVRRVAVVTSSASKVTTPSGFEVEGLGIDEIVSLIRSLS